jgi:hypothetical protein
MSAPPRTGDADLVHSTGLHSRASPLTIPANMKSFYGYWWFTDGRRPA